MLLIKKMQEMQFSNSERIVIDYILQKEERIKEYSTKRVADETFTSPSILIRIAKKLNFNGWNDWKVAYINELNYLKNHFQDIDANIPFIHTDSLMTVANKIATVHTESISDTRSLLQYETLQKAVQLIDQSHTVKIFAASNNVFPAQQFQHKLDRINKPALVPTIVDDIYFDAGRCTRNDCAIVVSYSGETIILLEVCEILKKRKVPIIAITSLGENRLSKYAQATLHITTREREYSKISGFSSTASISLILDTLYACLFSLNYQANFDYKVKLSQSIEDRYNVRDIRNETISEEN